MDDYTPLQPTIHLPDNQSARRRLAHLRLWRVLLGLLVAPLLGAIAMTWGINALSGIFGDEERRTDWHALAIMFFWPSLWSLLCGLVYLQTITRVRDQIARFECLLLGCGSGFLVPLVLTIGNSLISRGGVPDLSWDDIGFFSIAGLIAAPFGLFGGWVFWCLAVKPAKAPTRDFADIFN